MEKKNLFWVSSSKKDLSKFPQEVQDEAIFALDFAREGESYAKAKAFKGFHNAKVIELVFNDRSGTFRVIYTVKFENVIYVLHSFQKKSKKGIKTTKQDVDLVHNRMKLAENHYREFFAKGK